MYHRKKAHCKQKYAFSPKIHLSSSGILQIVSALAKDLPYPRQTTFH